MSVFLTNYGSMFDAILSKQLADVFVTSVRQSHVQQQQQQTVSLWGRQDTAVSALQSQERNQFAPGAIFVPCCYSVVAVQANFTRLTQTRPAPGPDHSHLANNRIKKWFLSLDLLDSSWNQMIPLTFESHWRAELSWAEAGRQGGSEQAPQHSGWNLWQHLEEELDTPTGQLQQLAHKNIFTYIYICSTSYEKFLMRIQKFAQSLSKFFPFSSAELSCFTNTQCNKLHSE